MEENADSYISQDISTMWNANSRIWTRVSEFISYDGNYYTYYTTSPTNRLIGLEGRVFVNGPKDLGSIPGRVIPKTLKMVLYASLLNTQQYKVSIKGNVEQSRERSSALPYTFV